MPSPPASFDPDTLDHMKRLPSRNQLSILLVLAVTALNAFNDNILKMMLVGLAPKVTAGFLGSKIGELLGAMILLPFIIFAPLAGFLADRYSKRSIIMSMLVAQAAILLLAGACFEAALGEMSIVLALVAFFLLAAQSTFFSPGKMGILKEVSGSRRLGMVCGWLQMVTMIGILAGLGVGGAWFDSIYTETKDAWAAAARPIWLLFGVAMVALAGGWFIQRTPSHPNVKFHASLLWEHFLHLRESLQHRGMRRAFFGNAAYWFVASLVAAMFVDIGVALFPDRGAPGAATASSHMTLMIGLGTVAGSLFVSWVNRRGLQLGIIPLGALGLAATLFLAAAMTVGTRAFDGALVAIGFMGACYMVPIQAYIQDRANPEKRGRVLASMNLLDSVAGISGVVFLVVLKLLGLGFTGQFCVLGVLMLIAAIYVVRLLPQDLARFVVLAIVRTIYKVKAVHAERVPKEGGVLLLANHTSYVDALIVGAACQRPVRFVMWDVLYQLWWLNWFLRIVGTVPISATRAKDAVRTVAAALKEGEVVCLFPEGQITRHGMINELRKGFELMARQADVPVQPVYLDGLYGSIFSYEGGKVFKKWPRRLRYPVEVLFGQPLHGREGTNEAVRLQLLELGSEGFLNHEDLAETEDPQATANALRLRQVEWARPGDAILCMEPAESVIAGTLRCYARLQPAVRLLTDVNEAEGAGSGRVLAVGTTASCAQLKDLTAWPRVGKLALCWGDVDAGVPDGVAHLHRGLLHAETGALLATSVPDPLMPKPERDNQHGTRAGSFGRLLPGLKVEVAADGLRISGLKPHDAAAVTLPGVVLDDEGFLVRPPAVQQTASPEGEAVPERSAG
jgi:acyl-[acyl-carrier-protein]-phospholipid O-acyltransferase/long-chain-fatty-acid--[acyl-carrier-protein] ligase